MKSTLSKAPSIFTAVLSDVINLSKSVARIYLGLVLYPGSPLSEGGV